MNAKTKKRRAKKTKEGPVTAPKMPFELIQEQLVKNILVEVLALQVLRNTEKPAREVYKELLDIEFNAGQLIGMAMQARKSETPFKPVDVLPGVLSFIPFHARQKSKEKVQNNTKKKTSKRGPSDKKSSYPYAITGSGEPVKCI